MFDCASTNADAVDKDRQQLKIFVRYKFKTNYWHGSNETGRLFIMTHTNPHSLLSCSGNNVFMAYIQHV